MHWWSFSTFARNRAKFAGLRQDPAHGHLQWTELTRHVQARAFIIQRHSPHRA